MAGGELTKDNADNDSGDDEFVTTPQIADGEEMATRRVVKVRRPAGGAPDATGNSASSAMKVSGLFSGLSAAVAPSSAAGSTTTTAMATTTTSGLSPPLPSTVAAKPVFGFSSISSRGDQQPVAPAATFGFGTPRRDSGSSVGPVGASASTESGSGERAAPVPSALFGLTAAVKGGGVAPAETPAVSAEGGAVAATSAKPIFGAGAFSFSSAVNSFVEARKKMQEEKTADGDASGDAKVSDDDKADDDSGESPVFGVEVTESAARDVLASAPTKLYRYEKAEGEATGKWAERGAGEAKLICQEVSGGDDAPPKRVYRLLVRGGYAMNATLGKNRFTISKAEEKHLIVAIASAEGPQTYLINFTGSNAVASAKKFSEELKRAITEADKS